MSDASTAPTKPFRLLDLPVEVRVKIFAHMLLQPETIKLETRSKGYRCRDGRETKIVRSDAPRYRENFGGQIQDPLTRKWHTALPSPMALLLVCKSVHEEAREVAYETNSFSFWKMAAATSFIELVGTSAKFIRHVILLPGSYALACAPVFFNRLARAIDLRLLQISHQNFCARKQLIDDVATQGLLMLNRLQDSYERRQISVDVRDVIQVDLTLCPWRAQSHANGLHMQCYDCQCSCDEAEEKKQGLATRLRSEISNGLRDLSG